MEEKKYTVMRNDTGKLYIDVGGEVEVDPVNVVNING
jgi:hypothetical protein